MGDRTWTSIEFSGTISEEQGEELLALLKDQACVSNLTDSTPTLNDLKESTSFYDDECNYATMEDIEAWCPDNNVGYLKSWEAGGDYGPGIEVWRPGMARREHCASIENSPVVTLADLVEAQAEGVAALITKLQLFDTCGPPLRVLAVDDWTDELCHFMAKRALLDE